ncbi:MAG: hypothetical protein D6820_13735, partial [Lentisphaerae bacterium]
MQKGIFVLACLIPFIVLSQTPESRGPVAVPRLGINLAGPCDWNTEIPLVDVFRMARPWISQKKGEKWGKGPKLSLDEHGWVTRLEPDCWAETLVCNVGSHIPAGTYTVLYEGEGKIEFARGIKIVDRQPGRISIEVSSNNNKVSAIWLRLTATNPNNYIRNIHVILPGYLDSWQKNPWTTHFLQRWQGMACLRFMDLMHTNNSPIRHWSERPQLSDATWSRKGLPLEVLIDLANRLKIAPWFCIPHQADDEYVRQTAAMIKAKLDPKLKFYIEYSNEVWNGMFAQNKYAGQEGMKRGFAEKPWEAAWCFYAWRSVQIFKIFSEVFGTDSRRMVRVLASQAANAYVSNKILSFRDAGKQADALAIAPYITCNIPSRKHAGKKTTLTAETFQNYSVDQALDYLQRESLPRSISWMKKQKEVADKFHLLLIAYEGGQHMVGVRGGENNKKLEALLHAANRHPRMGTIYQQYFDAWAENGGDLFCVFSSVGRWSKWGSWGLLEYWDQPPQSSPKFMATLR